jgi:mycothiol synthase
MLTHDPAGALAWYAMVEAQAPTAGAPADPPSGELVVHPSLRRRGHGHALLTAVRMQAGLLAGPDADHGSDRDGAVRVWAHGNLAQARAFATAVRFRPARELWQMSRPLTGDLPAVRLPDGFSLRSYRPGTDDADWLRVNAAAFAHHPEQGSWSQRDLDLRLAEPWFDATGFLVLQDDVSSGTPMAGYHWTKVHPGTADAQAAVGEVYVVGIDPSYQGRGLSMPLVAAGLIHLRDHGLTRVMLYVDADNEAAVHVYSQLGFSTSSVDVMFTPGLPTQ